MATLHGAQAPTQHSAGEDARARLLFGLPVNERRLELAGVSTAVLEGGDGPPMVLLAGEFAAVWMRVLPDLVTTHRVIAPDLPGLGASEVPDGPLDADTPLAWLDELIDQTCAIPPVLVGRGIGGALAARFTIDHSHRVDGLVLVDTYGLDRFRPPPRMALSFIRVLLRPSERGLQRSFRNYCFVDLDGVRAAMGERYEWMAAYALDRFRAPSVKAAMRSLFRQLAPTIPAEHLDRIAVPTTLIWGRQDAAERRRGSQRPPRLAAARDRQRPR
jgi:pimeloyl-ACP methyl ester carboxylesterase